MSTEGSPLPPRLELPDTGYSSPHALHENEQRTSDDTAVDPASIGRLEKSRRKVQWSEGTALPAKASPVISPSTLDEAGMDHEAFMRLQSSLIRQSLRRNDSNLSLPSSSSSSPTSNTTTAFPSTDVSRAPTPPPAEPNAYIPFGETDGLPADPHSDRSSLGFFAKRAQKLVASHGTSGMKKFMHKRTASGRPTADAKDPEKNEEEDEEEEHRAFAPMHSRPQALGVLGSLLAMHHHHHASTQSSSGISTPTTTTAGQRSRVHSIASSDTDGTMTPMVPQSQHKDHKERKSFQFLRPPPIRAHSSPGSVPTLSTVRQQDQQEKEQQPSPASPSSPEFRQYKKKPKLPDPLHLRPPERPKSARNGAGVFGALVGAGATIAGAATPQNASVAPDLKRSGFHLNRYSLAGHETNRSSESLESGHRSAPTSPLSSTFFGQGGGRSPPGPPLAPTHSHSPTTSTTSTAAAPSNEPRQRKSVPSFKQSQTGWQHFMHAVQTPLGGGHKHSRSHVSSLGTSDTEDHPGTDGYFSTKEKDWAKAEAEKERKARKKAREKRKKEQIYITMHVAAMLHRQEFLLKLCRALLMFGAPSHRLEAQMSATARVLDVNMQCIYLPGMMLISFGDPATHTSETRFIKQGATLDLDRLLLTHYLYWKVTHDEMSVSDASKELDELMLRKELYNAWWTILIGGCCSAFITPLTFKGSMIDSLLAFPLGMLLCGIQLLSARNDLFGQVFEIAIAALNSFIAAALSQAHNVCYSAVIAGSVVLILPGYIVLCGSLELSARNIVSGSVRMFYAIIYSLFLGFGISIGAELWYLLTGLPIDLDFTCASRHNDTVYQRTPGEIWYILFVPAYAFFITLRQNVSLRSRELPLQVLTAITGWVVNFYAGKRFQSRSDLTSAVGSFAVGILGNLWGKFSHGAAFTMMLPAALFQLPTGLSNGGLLHFAQRAEKSTTTKDGSNISFSNGLSVGQSLIQVAIGLTVGLFFAAVVVHPLGGARRRRAAIFSF